MDTTRGYLDKLSNLNDWKVEENDTDVRGFEFVTKNGEKIGEVEDLVANTSLEKVVYLGVDLTDDVNEFRTEEYKNRVNAKHQGLFGEDEDRKIIVPVGTVKIDEANRQVIASANYNRNHFADSPRIKGLDSAHFTPANEVIIVDHYTKNDNKFDKYRTEETYQAYQDRKLNDEVEFYDNDLYKDRGYFKDEVGAPDSVTV